MSERIDLKIRYIALIILKSKFPVNFKVKDMYNMSCNEILCFHLMDYEF